MSLYLESCTGKYSTLTSIWDSGLQNQDTCGTCDSHCDNSHKRKAEKAFEVQREDKNLAATNEDVFYVFRLAKDTTLTEIEHGDRFQPQNNMAVQSGYTRDPQRSLTAILPHMEQSRWLMGL